MALKRTRRPFYTKGDAYLERYARHTMAGGDHDRAAELFRSLDQRQRTRLVKNARQMAHRPIGKFLKVGKSLGNFIRRYSSS